MTVFIDPTEQLSTIASRWGDSGERLKLLSRDIHKQNCSIGVFGEFSRGKSAVINALVGREILPVDLRPSSAGVVTLKYGKTETIRTQGGDAPRGETRLIDADLTLLQTEETGGAEHPVERADITLNIDRLRGYQLVDTPGVNDLGETNPELIYKLLPQVDVAVFIVDAASGGMSATERSFFRECVDRPLSPPVIIVLNKMDRIGDDPVERQELTAEIEQAVADVIQSDVTLVPGTFESGHADLPSSVASLWGAIHTEVERGPAIRRRRLVHDCVGELEESLKGISLALDQSQVDLEAREKRLSLSREALRGAFQQFAKHADYTARPALKAMLEKSLQTLVRQSTDNLTRRISSAPSPAQYASEFMERDLTSWSQEWLDSHTTELQQFLARHRKAVSLDFERNFGGALRLHSSLSMENRTAVVPASLDATELVDAEKNAKLATYVIPAGVGLLAAWVAGPLAIVGLVGGRLIADHNVQERAAAARSVLCHDAERTAEAAASALRQRLEPAIDRYFQELASAIQSQANDRLQQAELAFESARKRSASSKEQKEEIRHSIKNDMGLLNTIRNSL